LGQLNLGAADRLYQLAQRVDAFIESCPDSTIFVFPLLDPTKRIDDSWFDIVAGKWGKLEGSSCWWFELENDAMLFKLAWCGA
jgi:hypothetical protein